MMKPEEEEEEEVDEKQERTKKSLIMCVTRVKFSIFLSLSKTSTYFVLFIPCFSITHIFTHTWTFCLGTHAGAISVQIFIHEKIGRVLFLSFAIFVCFVNLLPIYMYVYRIIIITQIHSGDRALSMDFRCVFSQTKQIR